MWSLEMHHEDPEKWLPCTCFGRLLPRAGCGAWGPAAGLSIFLPNLTNSRATAGACAEPQQEHAHQVPEHSCLSLSLAQPWQVTQPSRTWVLLFIKPGHLTLVVPTLPEHGTSCFVWSGERGVPPASILPSHYCLESFVLIPPLGLEIDIWDDFFFFQSLRLWCQDRTAQHWAFLSICAMDEGVGGRGWIVVVFCYHLKTPASSWFQFGHPEQTDFRPRWPSPCPVLWTSYTREAAIPSGCSHPFLDWFRSLKPLAFY